MERISQRGEKGYQRIVKESGKMYGMDAKGHPTNLFKTCASTVSLTLPYVRYKLIFRQGE